jgi:ribonuclease HII|tara:strand:- start:1965 stop:2552 length:588 start_codon:yes stop_codon:yes gene_type:complete
MIEDKIWEVDPNQNIIGSDEVGRGCFAGPISAASVKINYSHINLLNDVKDSKKLSPKKRRVIFDRVLENNIQYSYQSLDNKFIDIYGIKVANEKVLENSISSVYETGDSVYVDHFKIKKYNSISLIRGEDNCRAIALASIIAKVIRDEYMIEISNSYSNYHLHNNKGYGTKEHRKAISKYGLSDIHRKSFNLMPK